MTCPSTLSRTDYRVVCATAVRAVAVNPGISARVSPLRRLRHRTDDLMPRPRASVIIVLIIYDDLFKHAVACTVRCSLLAAAVF